MGGRTVWQCRQRWNDALDPSIKRGEWGKEEDAKLTDLVGKYGTGHGAWPKIASEMGGRVAWQCRQRWNNHLVPIKNGEWKPIKKGDWGKEEDKQLTDLVGKHGTGRGAWPKIASEMGGRVAWQCRLHWNNHLDPTIKKGDWGKEEDKQLTDLVGKHGTGRGAWPKIASEMGGRTVWQCRQRWNNHLDPSNNKATKSELAAAAKKAGDDHFAKLEDERKARVARMNQLEDERKAERKARVARMNQLEMERREAVTSGGTVQDPACIVTYYAV